MASRIKKGDEVVVITGESRGERGKVLRVFPARERVLVEGVNLRKKHERRTQDSEGGIVEREASLHLSNVMLGERYDRKRGTSAE